MIFRLRTKGIDNEGQELEVTFDPNGKYGPTVKLMYSPGYWLLNDFLSLEGDKLFIDAGQNWLLTNVGQIKEELKSIKELLYE